MQSERNQHQLRQCLLQQLLLNISTLQFLYLKFYRKQTEKMGIPTIIHFFLSHGFCLHQMIEMIYDQICRYIKYGICSQFLASVLMAEKMSHGTQQFVICARACNIITCLHGKKCTNMNQAVHLSSLRVPIICIVLATCI